MKIDVKKYLLIGPQKQKDLFFARVQELGLVEFIKPRPENNERTAELQTFFEALHVLRQREPVSQLPDKDYSSAHVLAQHIIELNDSLERLHERSRILHKEIERIEVFGDFLVSDLHFLEKEAHRKVHFFFTKKSEVVEALKNEPDLIYIRQLHGLYYFISLSSAPPNYPGLIEMRVERPVGEVHDELARIQRDSDNYGTELARLTHYQSLLKQGLTHALNFYNLNISKERAENYLEGDLFAIEGWVSVLRTEELKKVSQEMGVYVEQIAIEERDRIPTHLENQGVGRLGEDLVSIYDVPAHSDRDPSRWVFFAFMLFFSMIISDAGYGVLLLGLALFLGHKFKKRQGFIKRIISLLRYLSVGCIIWGVLSASFFGISLDPESRWRAFSLTEWMAEKKAEFVMQSKDEVYKDLTKTYPKLAQVSSPHQFLWFKAKNSAGKTIYPVNEDFNDNVLMELVLFIGTIHIILSFLRYLDRNWAGIGWVLFMIGGYLYFPVKIHALSLIHYLFHVPFIEGGVIGVWLLFIGMGLAAILAVCQKKWNGLGEIMNVIGVFADVMSYLRIYALALAGVIMAGTFNHIGLSVPWYLGIFIILAGHTINIVLALMGGIIHGLRLNFIEWYHYSFEGGGIRFSPLSLLKTEGDS